MEFGQSLDLYSLTKGSKKNTNPSKIKLSTSKVKLAVGKTKKIKAKVVVPKSKRHLLCIFNYTEWSQCENENNG